MNIILLSSNNYNTNNVCIPTGKAAQLGAPGKRGAAAEKKEKEKTSKSKTSKQTISNRRCCKSSESGQ